ncbi:MAG: aspartate--tRNA ligase [Clostridiales bacterium]|nr:aspartate--tRNA ligase [Clostridiales bacterium]
MKRTAYCGGFRENHVGREVCAAGWVQRRRDMGGVIFIDLRDREGILQVVCSLNRLSPADFHTAETLRNESVIAVRGRIAIRDAETYNPRLPTGTVELRAQSLTLLNGADTPPFPPEEAGTVREELRLRYRYLDLRREEMQRRLRLRHETTGMVRRLLEEEGFWEIETPTLTQSTPEGARDYLVPSRVAPGAFYALPQSPQLFKQLLMVGGVDKYYQIARCYRDEDLRADRQPEFTQVDMELSFVEQEEILTFLESLFRRLLQQVKGIRLPDPVPRLTWREAMDTYGSDKPDLRFGLPLVDVTSIAGRCGFSVFRGAVESGGVVRAINVKGGASFTRSDIEELTEKALSLGAKGMAWIMIRPDGELYSVLTKYFTQEDMSALLDTVDGRPGDFLLFCADALPVVRRVLGGLRLHLGDRLGLRKKDDWAFLFVTDFPAFEYAEEEHRWVAAHHPFTMPYPDDIPYLSSDPARVRSQAFDAVLNGVELGSGSMRIHRRDIQQALFGALGFSPKEIEKRFGFFVEAFRYGVPPHGGFAFGLDRLVMLLAGADSLREVIAFPKLRDGSCPLTGAPGTVEEAQLSPLGLTLAGGDAAASSVPAGATIPHDIDVDRIAQLSMLTLTDEEKDTARRELSEMLAFADQIARLDTEGIPPTAHVLPVSNVLREDVPQKSYPRDNLLDAAPAVQDGCFAVPRTVE